MRKKIFVSCCVLLFLMAALGLLAFGIAVMPYTELAGGEISFARGFLLPAAIFVPGLVLLGMLPAWILAKRITAPLLRIDPERPPTDGGYEELAPIFRYLEKQKGTIEKQLAQARQKQEEFRVLSENMEEGILIVDRGGVLLSSNGAARNFREDGAEEIDRVLASALEGKHKEKSVVREGRYYRLLGSPVLQNDRIVGAVALVLDETQKRSLEQFRREFTANVSHELKTPITSISGFAELMQNGLVASEDMRDFAGNIYSEAQRLLTLVNDIIRLSRIEDGSLPYDYGEVDLYRLAEEVLTHLRPAADAMDVSLSLDGTHETVRAAEPILYDVIYNLCDNAIKYNKRGGDVQIYVGDGDRGTVITVRDTGIGIPAEHKDRVFERFYRVDKSHSKEIGGTGLGLSIVRHGVEYHGGELRLDSKEGEGTTVTVLFPEGKTRIAFEEA